MIVSCEEMKRIEEEAFAAGVSAEALMEEAGMRMARAIRLFFPMPGKCRVFYGKGHNGGDALVTARLLFEEGWEVELAAVFPEGELSELTRKKLKEYVAACEKGGFVAFAVGSPLLVLDGVLGIGAARRSAETSGSMLREPVLGAAREMRRLRREAGAVVFALDVPTGLDADSGEPDPEAVPADYTLCVGLAKRGLLADAALDWVGRLAVLPLPELEARAGAISTLESVATPATMGPLLPRRAFSTHKGQCGRVGIVAGSRGFAGAAVMAANAAVRAGAGLVSLFVTPDIYAPVASAAMPEVMVTPVDCYLAVLERPLDVLAIGPGLGREDAEDLLAVCEYFKGPMVVDAEALNLLSGHLETLRRALGPRLLTPHPGEMKRLFPEADRLSRRETAERFLEAQSAGRAPVTLLLKGSRTLVAERMGGATRLSWNTTGTPGMATGGMGDVLTGTCAALVGQGLSLFDAARVGAWVCGRAAEWAMTQGGESQESLAATDLFQHMGRAFRDLRDPLAF